MQESITAEMIRSIYNRTPEPQAMLITLVADGIDPLYLTNWPDGIVSRGQTYEFFPFKFSWPGASRDEPVKTAKLEIMNRDRRIAEGIRLATGVPLMTIELIRVSAPDVVEMALTDASLSDAEVDDPTVTGTIVAKSFKTEPACSARYTYARTPGLF